jgi:hypothetical protein
MVWVDEHACLICEVKALQAHNWEEVGATCPQPNPTTYKGMHHPDR